MNIWTHFAASTSVFFLFVFFVNAEVPCKYMTSFFGREKPHNVCSLLHLFISVCRVPQRLRLILRLGSLMRSSCVLRDRNSSVWKFFSSVARWCFWGRHLEASASSQLLPVSLRCLSFLTAFIYPAALYLGPSSPSLSINSEIRERRGSEWLVLCVAR